MRKYLTLLIMLALTAGYGQVPDSLNVILPWQNIYVSSCSQDLGVGPTTENDNVFISEPEIQIINNADGQCSKILRTFYILSWNSSSTYEFIQIATVNDSLSFGVIEDLTITYDQLPVTFNVLDLIDNPIADHMYSFSLYDVHDTELSFQLGASNTSENVVIYDHTAMAVNNVDVYITNCEDDVIIDIPETATVNFEKEQYILLTQELLGVNIEYPCDNYEVEIKHGVTSLLYPNTIGKSIEVTVTIDPDNGISISETIVVSVTGQGPEPVPMYIEEKNFTAGEEVTFDVWSDQIESLIAWQFRLNFIDAELLSITPGLQFEDIPNNIFNDGKTINTLWFPADVMPINIASNETWFTLTVVPLVDGSTLDIFTTENDPWSSIVIYDENDIIEYPADFSFLVEERNFLVNNEKVELTNIKINTLVSDWLNVSGLDIDSKSTIANVYDMNGEKLISSHIGTAMTSADIDVSTLTAGVYICRIEIEGHMKSYKFVKI